LMGKGAGHGAVMNGKVFREQISSGRGALADALGDQSDVGSDAGSEAEPELSPELRTLNEEEKKDKSIKGSVY
jgi:hypothetical protein